MIKVRNGSEIDGTLISEIKEGQFGVAVKLFDKQKAMLWISENIGIATDEQKVKIELIRAQIDNLNKDNDTGEGGVIIVNDIPRSNSDT
jgi:phage terminase small subunit